MFCVEIGVFLVLQIFEIFFVFVVDIFGDHEVLGLKLLGCDEFFEDEEHIVFFDADGLDKERGTLGWMSF